MRKEPTVESVVFVIDDDAAVRASLKNLLNSVGLHVEVFGSADEFLKSQRPDAPSCLVLDVRLPGISGLEFQTELAQGGTEMPIIFLTAHGDILMGVQAMKAGAVEFLTKPCREQDLLDSVRLALARNRERREGAKYVASLKADFATLTAREKELIGFVAAGFLNKQIAGEMGVSEATVKMHRGNIMRKMHARSLADLVRMADLLGVTRGKHGSP
jgi:FixJ family two-component response regulator